MIELIEKHRAELNELCRKYRVKTLEVFGSATDGTWDAAQAAIWIFSSSFSPKQPSGPSEGFFDLRDELQQLFGRKVDLVMPGAIRNPYFLKAVNQQRQVLYAA